MIPEIKPCPFCGGKAKVSYRKADFMGQNVFGDVKLKYRVQVICNRCHGRGRPVKTGWMINPRPITKPEDFTEYVRKAVTGWNDRKEVKLE